MKPSGDDGRESAMRVEAETAREGTLGCTVRVDRRKETAGAKGMRGCESEARESMQVLVKHTRPNEKGCKKSELVCSKKLKSQLTEKCRCRAGKCSLTQWVGRQMSVTPTRGKEQN